MDADLIDRIHNWLPPDRRAEFVVLVRLSDDYVKIANQFSRWAMGVTGCSVPFLALDGKSPVMPMPPPALLDRARRRAKVAWELRKRFPLLFEYFEERLVQMGWLLRGDRKRLKESLVRRDPEEAGFIHGPARVQVAYERVLGPFLDVEDSGGIELSWEEGLPKKPKGKRATRKARGKSRLSITEKVLKLGMERELVLMSRQPDRERFKLRAMEKFRSAILLDAFTRYALDTLARTTNP